MRLTTDEAFRAYGDRIFRAALSVCRNRADADDVVQDVMIRYHSLGQQYESEEHLRRGFCGRRSIGQGTSRPPSGGGTRPHGRTAWQRRHLKSRPTAACLRR